MEQCVAAVRARARNLDGEMSGDAGGSGRPELTKEDRQRKELEGKLICAFTMYCI